MLPADSATATTLRAAEPELGTRKRGAGSWAELAKTLATSPAMKKKGVR